MSGSSSAELIAQPFSPSKHSSHQPSRMLQLRAPLSAAFMPLVPHASSGRRGLFSHTSQPWYISAGDGHVVVGDEHEAVAHVELAGEQFDLADHVLAGLVGRVGLAGEHELHRPVGASAASCAAGRAATAAAWRACRWRSGGRSRWSSAVGVEQGVAQARPDERRPARARPCARAAQTSARSTAVDARPRRRRRRRPTPAPTLVRAGARRSWSPTQVWACTPLVIAPIGTSSTGTSGHRPLNISRLTSPCSWATPLAAAGEAQPHDGHVEAVSSGSSCAVAEGHQLVEGDAALRRRSRPKYFSISSRGNRSMPAGTGVWVVNTPPARTASTASAKRECPRSATSSRMRSSDRKPAWPSLVWNTCGSQAERPQGAHAADAEHDLLAEAVLDVAAVQAVGDAARPRRCCPRRRCRAGTAGFDRPSPATRATARVRRRGRRSTCTPVSARAPARGVEAGEALLLLAVGVEPLAEVALGVEQPDGDEGHAEVAGRLQVVAGEDAEAAASTAAGSRDRPNSGEKYATRSSGRVGRGPGTSAAPRWRRARRALRPRGGLDDRWSAASGRPARRR